MIPQLDTRGMNLRAGTMAGANVVGQQQRTANLSNRNLLLKEELENRPTQREREGQSFEMAKKMHEKRFEDLLLTMDDKAKARVKKELDDVAIKLAGITDAQTWNKVYDAMIKQGKGDALAKIGFRRDGYSPEAVEYFQNDVAGQQGVLKKIEARNRAAAAKTAAKTASVLQAQTDKARSALQTQSDKAALERTKVTASGKKSSKENPIKKDLRDRYQSVKSEHRRLTAGVDIIPGMPEAQKEKAIKDAAAELDAIAKAYVKNGGDLKDLGAEETKKTRYTYKDGKLTLK